MTDPLANLYKIRGDAQDALLDKIESELSLMLTTIRTMRAALAEQDKKFKLTSGGGGKQELLATVRKNFPKFANATDEEILKAFGGV